MEKFFEKWAPSMVKMEIGRDKVIYQFAVTSDPRNAKGVRLLAGEELRDLVPAFVSFTDAFEHVVDRFTVGEERYEVPVRVCEDCEMPAESGGDRCEHCAALKAEDLRTGW